MESTTEIGCKLSSRGSILKAAESLFAKQGFQATTLKQISSRSGANGALVSYYFGSKDGLREAVISKKLESMEKILSSEHKNGTITGENLAHIVRDIFRHMREDESFHRLAQRALLEDKELKKSLISKLWEPFFLHIRDLLLAASQGELTLQDAEARSLVLCGTFHQYSHLRSFFQELKMSQPLDHMLEQYEDYVVTELLHELCEK